MSNAAALPKENICVGLLAHVDAGKTTLSEAMLYLSGRLRKLGRVDHRDSFLDTHRLERERGITIFSKQAVVELAKRTVTLMDTPGHVDFAAETERTLGVLDCAVLIISGLDGVQAHTETLWRLLKRNGVPCFVFVTKMDLSVRPREELLAELQTRLDERCVDFSRRDETFREQIALCDEAMMDRILSGGEPSDEELAGLIARRALFPCFFGSGLRLDGVEELLQAIDALAPVRERKEAFAARVFKLAHDPQGTRLCFLKLLGGEVLMMDDLYKELNSRCTRTDFTVEERKLDGKTFTVEVYPARDYTEQAAFYFDKDGQLVHVLVGTKDTPLVGESFFTVDPPDGKVDEKLFTTDGYTLE